MFRASLKAVLDTISDALADRLVPLLLRANGLPQDLAPALRFGDFDRIDIGVLGTFVKQLADAGIMTPDPATENHLREAAGLPDRDPDLPMPAPPMAQPAAGDPSAPEPAPAEQAKVIDLTPLLKALSA
jgi:hypothetical protein